MIAGLPHATFAPAIRQEPLRRREARPDLLGKLRNPPNWALRCKESLLIA